MFDTAVILVPQIARQGLTCLVHMIKATSVVLVPVSTWDNLMQLSLQMLRVKAIPRARCIAPLSHHEVRPAPPSDLCGTGTAVTFGVCDTARRL